MGLIGGLPYPRREVRYLAAKLRSCMQLDQYCLGVARWSKTPLPRPNS